MALLIRVKFKLEREINNLEILKTDNVREAYPKHLVDSFNESTPLDRYINQGLNNDKEAQRLRQEYNETKEKLINLAVEHNVRLKRETRPIKRRNRWHWLL